VPAVRLHPVAARLVIARNELPLTVMLPLAGLAAVLLPELAWRSLLGLLGWHRRWCRLMHGR